MSKPEEIFKLECTILSQTERALLILEPGGEKIWIPKSQCYNDDELPDDIPREGFDFELQISAWIAKEKVLR